MKLQWNVYIKDMNSKEIKVFNVFNHGRFYEDMKKCLNTCRGKDEFKTELRRDLMYYFGFKCEYEIVLTSWPPHITKEELERLKAETKDCYCYGIDLDIEKKIDVCQQIMLNYDRFIDYVWRNKDEIN